MKTVSFFKKAAAAFIIAAVALTGCDEAPGDLPVTIDDASLTQTAFADETAVASGVTFTTTVADGIAKASSVAWLAIDPDHGDEVGEYAVNITLEPNATGKDRSATITVTCDGRGIKITGTQTATKEDGTVPDNSPIAGNTLAARVNEVGSLVDEVRLEIDDDDLMSYPPLATAAFRNGAFSMTLPATVTDGLYPVTEEFEDATNYG